MSRTTAFDRLRELEELATMFPPGTAFWDDVPCKARRCLVEVLDPAPGREVRTWYVSLIGRTREAVEVQVPFGVSGKGAGRPGDVLYLDDTDGWAWAKVTQRFGGREVVHGHFHRVRVLGYLDD